MPVVVIDCPQPVVTPAEIPGGHAADDAFVKAMIAASTANLDGPGGWLGRAIGVQTLELRTDCLASPILRLPYPPIIAVLEGEVDAEPISVSGYQTGAPAFSFGTVLHRNSKVRIRYRAGYGKPDPDDETKLVNDPDVPEVAALKAAIILMSVGLLQLEAKDGGLRSFQVEGAFTKSFNSPELVDRVRNATVERLLAPLRVFA